MIKRPTRQRGFTLIEVMVALVIVSLGMMAVVSQVNQRATTSIILEETTLASWIGSNKVTELSLEPQWPDIGDSQEQVEFANRFWIVRTEVSGTDVENLRRVDVSVYLEDDPEQLIHRMTGIIEPPVPQGFVPVQWPSVGFGGGPGGRGGRGGAGGPGGRGQPGPGG